MYIYSITFVVEPEIDTQWKEWVKDKMLGELGEKELTVCRVLDQQHQGHFTYSIQVPTKDIPQYQKLKDITDSWMQKCAEKFGEKVLNFSTLLKKTEL